MKRIKPFSVVSFGFVLIFFVCFIMQGCALQKRHYRKGFYVQKFHKSPEKKTKQEREVDEIARDDKKGGKVPIVATNYDEPHTTASAQKKDLPHSFYVQHKNLPVLHRDPVSLPKQGSARPSHREESRKAEFMCIFGFLASVGGRVALVYLPIGILQGVLFAAGAILGALSMRKMSQRPEKY